MKNCIINFEDYIILDSIKAFGYNCHQTIQSSLVSKEISLHSDVLYNKLNSETILLSYCQAANLPLIKECGYKTIICNNLKPGYKTECLLNFIINDKYIIYNKDTAYNISFDNKTIISVKQGYTRCSTLVVNDNSYITGDRGIYNEIIKAGLSCLLIDDKEIELDGYDHGFIGGASVKLSNDKILFFGDFKSKETKNDVIKYLYDRNVERYFIKNKRLKDIGSALIL